METVGELSLLTGSLGSPALSISSAVAFCCIPFCNFHQADFGSPSILLTVVELQLIPVQVRSAALPDTQFPLGS